MPRTDKSPSRREGVVKVTVSDQEKAALQRAADKAGIPLSIYVRAAALEKAKASS